MTRKAFLDYCEGLEGAVLDCPFPMDALTTVARHEKNRRWFAILMQKDGADFANLKCEPAQGALMRASFQGIRPGYHMNKEHWISVFLDSDVPPDIIKKLVLDSHALTAPKMRRVKLKQEIT
ncbi:MAG: MmcQ/YjbR family DNA-binding protein [Bacillota bacterium]|nr:MmcQ/YjbR family DNA-binding protein [Bacillota bacterium]